MKYGDEGYPERVQQARDELQKSFDEGKVKIYNGWLIEEVGYHTCGTGEGGHYGAHEPMCGFVPIMDLFHDAVFVDVDPVPEQ